MCLNNTADLCGEVLLICIVINSAANLCGKGDKFV